MRVSHRRLWGLALALAGTCPAGCERPAPECTGIESYGLLIEVIDEDTGEHICDALVHLDHDRYSDDLAADTAEPCLYLGGTVPGQYAILVSRDNYETRMVEVQVDTAGSCTGLDPQEVVIELTPES